MECEHCGINNYEESGAARIIVFDLLVGPTDGEFESAISGFINDLRSIRLAMLITSGQITPIRVNCMSNYLSIHRVHVYIIRTRPERGTDDRARDVIYRLSTRRRV